MPKIRISTAQIKVSNSVEKNGVEIRKQIKIGKLQGSNIVHFCEGALSGYTKSQLINYQRIDFPKIRIEIEKIKLLCKELNILAVIGSAHELSKSHRPHNSLYIISDEGEIINRYDKRKCSHNELTNWYTPGFESCNFEIYGIKFGCILCIEIQFPELFIQAEKEDVDCILFSSYSREKMFGIQAQGYAATNNYWISMSVPANESEKLPSQFISPNGEVQNKCRRNCTSIITCEIDTEDEKWKTPIKYAKPWRRIAREGKIYSAKKVIDKRSKLKTII